MTQSQKNEMMQGMLYDALDEAQDRYDAISLIYEHVKRLTVHFYGNPTKQSIAQAEQNRLENLRNDAERKLQRAKFDLEYIRQLPVEPDSPEP